MIQIKEFIDTEHSRAITDANLFLAQLKEEDVIDVKYGSNVKKSSNGTENQRSAIMIIYRKRED